MAILIGLLINIGLAIWVHKDANSLRARGVQITPGLWSTLVFLGSIALFLIYILVRILVYAPKAKLDTAPLPKASGWTSFLTVIIIGIVVFGILASVVYVSLSSARRVHDQATSTVSQ